MDQNEAQRAPKESAAERVRRLAKEEQTRQLSEKSERAEDVGRQIEAAKLNLSESERQLNEVRDGLNAVSDLEVSGAPITREIEEIKAQLLIDRDKHTGEIREIGLQIEALQKDPAYLEVTAAKEAEKKEAERKEKEKANAAREKENKEAAEQYLKDIDAFVNEVTEAVRIAKQREQEIGVIQKEKGALYNQIKPLEDKIENELDKLLDKMPHDQLAAIREAVAEAKKTVTIYDSSRSRIPHPAAESLPQWYGAWKNVVKPWPLPFADKPLRALLAFEEDPQIAEHAKLRSQIKEFDRKAAELFADRKKTNSAFMEKFLADGGPASTIPKIVQKLRDQTYPYVNKDEANQRIASLSTTRKDLRSYLVADVGNEAFYAYENSTFQKMYTDPTY